MLRFLKWVSVLGKKEDSDWQEMIARDKIVNLSIFIELSMH